MRQRDDVRYQLAASLSRLTHYPMDFVHTLQVNAPRPTLEREMVAMTIDTSVNSRTTQSWCYLFRRNDSELTQAIAINIVRNHSDFDRFFDICTSEPSSVEQLFDFVFRCKDADRINIHSIIKRWTQ